MNQMDLTDIFRAFHPNKKEYSFFSVLQRTFFKADQILSHKVSLNRYKKIEMTSCILSDHHGLNLNFNNINKQKAYKLIESEQPSIKWLLDQCKNKLKTS